MNITLPGFSLQSNLVSFITKIVIQFVMVPHLDEIKQKSIMDHLKYEDSTPIVFHLRF